MPAHLMYTQIAGMTIIAYLLKMIISRSYPMK